MLSSQVIIKMLVESQIKQSKLGRNNQTILVTNSQTLTIQTVKKEIFIYLNNLYPSIKNKIHEKLSTILSLKQIIQCVGQFIQENNKQALQTISKSEDKLKIMLHHLRETQLKNAKKIKFQIQQIFNLENLVLNKQNQIDQKEEEIFSLEKQNLQNQNKILKLYLTLEEKSIKNNELENYLKQKSTQKFNEEENKLKLHRQKNSNPIKPSTVLESLQNDKNGIKWSGFSENEIIKKLQKDKLELHEAIKVKDLKIYELILEINSIRQLNEE